MSIEKLTLIFNKQIKSKCFVTNPKNLKVIYCKLMVFKQHTK